MCEICVRLDQKTKKYGLKKPELYIVGSFLLRKRESFGCLHDEIGQRSWNDVKPGRAFCSLTSYFIRKLIIFFEKKWPESYLKRNIFGLTAIFIIDSYLILPILINGS